jgi:betaine-aldehyde dehydrogenase
MCSWKLSSALAAGCTIVVKPSEFTPYATLELADICAAAGVPAGVVNVITGDGAVGAALTAHPAVDKISFTGSVPTGQKVMQSAAAGMKRITLELGGKSPAVIFDDANLESGLEWIAFGTFWNCGQICSATTRLLVQEGIAPRLTAKLAEVARKIVSTGGANARGRRRAPLSRVCELHARALLTRIRSIPPCSPPNPFPHCKRRSAAAPSTRTWSAGPWATRCSSRR